MANDTATAPDAPAAPPGPGTALTAPVHSGSPPVPAPQTESTLPAIVRRNVQVLRPIADAIVLAQAQDEGRKVIAELLRSGRDYGTVPGVSKPALFKPGAEKVNAAYGLVARFIVVEKEIDHYKSIEWSKEKWVGSGRNRRKEQVAGTSFGLYRYVINCELIEKATGEVVGSSLGSASTLESKYIDRPRDLENTIIKMAEKRAYLGATLLTHGLSEQFTQDVEDTGVASDDTPAGAPQEEQPPAPEIGSAEWAIAYVVPTGIHRGMKLPDDIKTFGQLTWQQLVHIAQAMEAIAIKTPARKDACDEVIRAARRMQDELEERAAAALPDPDHNNGAEMAGAGVSGL
jgi:hypothetical protein